MIKKFEAFSFKNDNIKYVPDDYIQDINQIKEQILTMFAIPKRYGEFISVIVWQDDSEWRRSINYDGNPSDNENIWEYFFVSLPIQKYYDGGGAEVFRQIENRIDKSDHFTTIEFKLDIQDLVYDENDIESISGRIPKGWEFSYNNETQRITRFKFSKWIDKRVFRKKEDWYNNIPANLLDEFLTMTSGRMSSIDKRKMSEFIKKCIDQS